MREKKNQAFFRRASPAPESKDPAKNMDDIARRMERMHFRRVIFGGVNEADVWRQLESLQKDYRTAWQCQMSAWQALVSERDKEIIRLAALCGNEKREP